MTTSKRQQQAFVPYLTGYVAFYLWDTEKRRYGVLPEGGGLARPQSARSVWGAVRREEVVSDVRVFRDKSC
jgi:hypothetical protein